MPLNTSLDQKVVFNSSARLWTMLFVACVLIWGQWCQASMGVDLERLDTSVDQVHNGCPSEISGASDDCDNCLDELLTDPRKGLENSDDVPDAGYEITIQTWFDDALVRYWRYRETLWSGLSRPIYLLISSFLE